ncbi:MAG: cytochrome c-type biogenesis protein CcmH [Alphaproteobacteria bacterium]
MRSLILILLLTCAIGSISPVSSARAQSEEFLAEETPLADPALEAQAIAIFRQLRCLVCEAESLASSPAPFAIELRSAVRQHLAKGESPEEIHNWLAASYGDSIRATPAWSPASAILWLTPLAITLAAILAWLVAIRTPRKPRKPR